MSDCDEEKHNSTWLDIVKRNGRYLRFIKESEQTEDVCIAAIRQNPAAFYYVIEKTPNICLALVSTAGWYLQFVKEQTVAICIAAVENDVTAFQFVKEQTPNICLAAVMNAGYLLELVIDQTPRICLEAVKQSGASFRFVREQTEEVCIEAVKNDPLMFFLVKNQTHAICMAAVQMNGLLLGLVKEQTEEICMAALVQTASRFEEVKVASSEAYVKCPIGIAYEKFSSGDYVGNLNDHGNIKNAIMRDAHGTNAFVEVFRIIKVQTPSLCDKAIRLCINVFGFVIDQTETQCLEVVSQKGSFLRCVKVQTPAICLAAVRQDHTACEFVKEYTPEICAIMLDHENEEIKDESTLNSYQGPIEKKYCIIGQKGDTTFKSSGGSSYATMNQIDKSTTHVVKLRSRECKTYALED